MPPRRQWIDKKSATTYQLFHRSQNDPLIHDPDADDRILHKISGTPTTESSLKPSRASKVLSELEKEFAGAQIRKNEGEAANYGIYYDDSQYDYMQHLRDLGGDGSGQSHFVEATPVKGKGKIKGMRLEEALKETSLDDVEDLASVRHHDALSTASTYSRKQTYQDQQDVPDAIAGFQPDMDPRLRETLEALEDDAFVDGDEDGDFFESLVQGGIDAEVDASEWRDTHIEDDDEGWESDATEKASKQPSVSTKAATPPAKGPVDDEHIPDTAAGEGDWLRNFAQYKKDMKSKPSATSTQRETVSVLHAGTVASTMFTAGGTPIRRKKRKGALTNPSAYSMTSSSLARTEGHRLLDDRFERIEALYAVDEQGEDYDGSSMADDMSVVSGMSTVSEIPSLVSGGTPLRSDFNQIMDGFLDGWDDRGVHAKRKGPKGKRGKNGNEVVGIRMLDEIRQGLGPARLPGKV
ncbi:low-temperature viability protein ltv1 [Histoplasma capsulatum]|uniref:Low-temperature viability protein ltv1 n=1 Tax=Ajellomyces capsulatus TaxID=5037 RepID=A0A8A1M1V5_AJECA|nr:low-temperature viability protein ltv1 [Histoplasma capsulatum]